MTTRVLSMRPVICPKCRREIDAGSRPEGSIGMACPFCRSAFSLYLFPQLSQKAPETRGERAMDGDAVCFFHTDRRAALPCEQCGRFICELCKIPLGKRNICPSCLSGGLKEEALPEIINRRMDWSGLALSIVILSMIFWPVCIITAPTAIGMAIRGWFAEGSLVKGRRRWLGAIAILIGLLQLGAFISLFWLARYGSLSHGAN